MEKSPTPVNLSAAQTDACAYGDFDLGAFLERLVQIGHDGGEDTLILIHSRMRARGANAFMETCQVALEAGGHATCSQARYLSWKGKLHDAGGEISREDCEQGAVEMLSLDFPPDQARSFQSNVHWTREEEVDFPASALTENLAVVDRMLGRELAKYEERHLDKHTPACKDSHRPGPRL